MLGSQVREHRAKLSALDRQQQKEEQNRAAINPSQTTGQDLVYTVHVSLDRTTMQIEDKQVSLVPGMAVTVAIKTGSRRVIEYLLSPLLRYKQEAMRER